MITVGRLIFSGYQDCPTEESLDPNCVMLYMAKAFGVELFLFEPKDIDPARKTINGQFFEDGAMFRKTVPIPPLVDNHYTGADDLLKGLTTLARVYPGDTKYTTYRDLKSSGRFEDILIPTFELLSFEALKKHLDRYDAVVVKPVLGAQGIGVIKIAKSGGEYQINRDGALCAFIASFPIERAI